MKNGFCIPWVLASIILCGCTSTRQMADQEFRPPSGSYKLIVMQPGGEVKLTSPHNASMAPNGMMLVHTGLLARMRNEAQLAAVA